MSPKILVGWTTTESKAEATELAKKIVSAGHAACVQVDGPIESHFVWKGEVNSDAEYRLMVKFAENKANAMQELLNKHHPYETPQWVVVRCEDAHPGYAQWVRDCCG